MPVAPRWITAVFCLAAGGLPGLAATVDPAAAARAFAARRAAFQSPC